MKVPKFLTAVATAAILFATSLGCSAAPKASYVEGVDWKNQVVTVIGEGIAPPDAVNFTQAKGMAVKAAKADAYRKMGELINGVRVDGETTVEKMLTTRDVVQLRVSATIKGAKVIEETLLSDGGCRVVMQVPLFGVSDSLAGAVFEKSTAIDPFPEPVLDVDPSTMPYNSATPVKRRFEVTKVTVEEEGYTPSAPTTPTTPYKSPLTRMAVPTLDSIILQKVAANSIYQQPVQNVQLAYDSPVATPQKRVKKSVEEYAAMAEGYYTGLVVDCRGLDLQPVMSPVIKNSNGTKIYGHKNLDIEEVIARGMADYIDDPDHVDRAGVNPLVVKAVAVENFNSNPVLAIPDSNRVLIENHATKFLKELNVVFLFD